MRVFLYENYALLLLLGIFLIKGVEGEISARIDESHLDERVARFQTNQEQNIVVCTGAFISSWWILTSAHCAQNSSAEEIFVGIMTQMPMPIDRQATRIHPEFMNNTLKDFALLKMLYPVPDAYASALLDDEDESTLNLQTILFNHTDDRITADDKWNTTNVSLQPCEDGFANSKGVTCGKLMDVNSAKNNFVYTIVQDQFAVVGLEMKQGVYARVSQAKTFIDSNVQGIQWIKNTQETVLLVPTPTLAPTPAAIPAATSTQSSQSVTTSIPPISGSSSSNNSTNNSTAASNGTQAGIDHSIHLPTNLSLGWLDTSDYPYAYLVSNKKNEQDQNPGCLGVLIAPLYVLTTASCMDSFNVSYAVFAEKQITQVVEVIFYPSWEEKMRNNLAIVRLQEEMALSLFSLEIEFAAPNQNLVDPSVEIQYLALQEDSTIKSIESASFQLPTRCGVDWFDLCVLPGKVEDRITRNHTQQGFVFYNKRVVGVISPTSEEYVLPHQKPYLNVSSLTAVQDFINQVTENTTVFTDGRYEAPILPLDSEPVLSDQPLLGAFVTLDENVQLALDHKSYVVGFETSRGFCGGSLIAPSFVLTSASCVVNTDAIDSVLIGSGSLLNEEVIPVKVKILHPLYVFDSMDTFQQIDVDGSQIPMTFQYKQALDFAILELEYPSTYTAPALMDKIPSYQTEIGQYGYQIYPHNSVNNSPSFSFNVTPDLATVMFSEKCSLSESIKDQEFIRKNMICIGKTDLNEPSDDGKCSGARFCKFRGHGEKMQRGNRMGKVFPSGSSLIFETGSGDMLTGVKGKSDDLYAALSTVQAFIDVHSVGHYWKSPHQTNFFKKRTRYGAGINAGITPAQPFLPVDKSFVVGLRESKYGQNFCGGTLISSQFVLTAAHCVESAKWVSIGSKLSSGPLTEPLEVTNVIVHNKRGTPYSFSYDVAILELDIPAYSQPIWLDNSKDYSEGMEATMYGYGAVDSSSNELSPVVKIVDLPLLPKAKCEKVLPEVDASVLCAGGVPGNDACQGDSGSPLVITASNREYLAGIVSAGYGCGLDGVPGIYIRLASIEDFINSYVPNPHWRYPSDPNGGSQNSKDDQKDGNRNPSNDNNGEEPTGVSLRSNNDRGDFIWSGGNNGGGGDNGRFDSALSSLPIPSDLPRGARDGLLEFLIGRDISMLPKETLNSIYSGETQLIFYSSGNLDGIKQVITKHASSPLYQRKNRFKRQSNTNLLPQTC